MDQPVELPAVKKPTWILVLQGGGATGAYHVGAFQALREYASEPDRVCGISIGGITSTRSQRKCSCARP